ncbi:hypothetical protein Ahy_A06g029484 [Arachis hypogaea]|uniref:DUF223 domain-containing protein n=1 Tax=Arachis hypogaea TaxID=3818 RepID=A0A445CTG3_ARAHY|nr:hypothetical protein Ahy_A06g029484 [Arachis hypogaea]
MAFVSRFVELLRERMVYQITYFSVGCNVGNFKTTHHEYMVNLNQYIDVYRLPESSIIPQYEFSFLSFDTFNTSEFDYTYLIVLDILLKLKVQKFLKMITNLSSTVLLN